MSAMKKPEIEQEKISKIISKDGNVTAVAFREEEVKKEIKEKKQSTYGSSLTNAIRDLEDIEAAKQWLLNQPQRYFNQPLNIRNYCLFVFCCNCARRISDVLKFDICDVVNSNGNIKKKINLWEKKTKKYAYVFTNPSSREALERYLTARAGCDLKDKKFKDLMKEPLFLSRENQRLKRHQAWKILSDLGDEIGLTEKGINFAPHGCRKTWAYQSLKNNAGNPIAMATVSEALNHSSEKVTRKYADITEEEIEKLYNSTVL